MNRFKDLRIYAGALLFFAAFLLYLATLSPSVNFGDSGELISMSYTLGIPHPTGFPLYILLGKIFSLLPLANIAFRFNIMSAAFAALVPAVLFYIFNIFVRSEENRTLRLYLPLAVSALFIISYTLWSQAVIARIYTINALFCALALLCFLHYREVAPDKRALYMLAFLTGFGSGLHLTAVIFACILWAYLAVKDFNSLKKIVFPLLFIALAGASIHLYTVIRGRAVLALKWQRLDTLSDFFGFITQQQYKSKMFTRSAKGYSYFFWFIKDAVIREFSGAGFFAAFLAVILALMNRFKYTWLFIILFLSNILLMAAYGTYTDLKLAFRYLIPSYIIACFFIFLLGFYILKGIKNTGRAAVVAALLFISIFLSCMLKNYFENDRSSDFIAYNYPHDLLSFLPPRSYVFTSGDNQIYTIAYDKFVENRFTDAVIEDDTDTIFKDVDDLMDNYIAANSSSNVLMAFKKHLSPVFSPIEYTSPGISQSLYGFMVKVSDGRAEPDVLYPWRLYSLKGILRGTDISYTFEEREVLGFYLLKMGDFYKKLGNKKLYYSLYEEAAEKAYDSVPVLGNLAIRYSANNSDLPEGPQHSEILFTEALALDPDNANISFNAGSFYARLGLWQKAWQFFNKTAEIDPSNIMAKIYLEKVQKELDKQSAAKNLLKEQSVHFDAGRELLKKKQYEQALEEFSRDIEANPEYDRSYFHMGLIYSIQGSFEKAIPMYEKAIENNSKETSAMNNLGIIYYKMGKREDAKTLFERSLGLRPNQPRIQRMLDDIK